MSKFITATEVRKAVTEHETRVNLAAAAYQRALSALIVESYMPLIEKHLRTPVPKYRSS